MASRLDITMLRQEAGSAGDHDLVALCDQALDGCDKSHRECERVISDAQAMLDPEDLDEELAR